jgi:hypothetical protein
MMKKAYPVVFQKLVFVYIPKWTKGKGGIAVAS